MAINRRNFIKGLGSTLALSALPSVQSFAFDPFKTTAPNEEIFVFVFLRGGCDALNLVAPMGDRFYDNARPAALKVPESGKFQLKNGLGRQEFNIHPKAAALKELYDSGDLAIVHATGLSNGTRSHFEAMNMIERGLVTKQSSAQGWMTRYFETINATGKLPAVAIGNNLPDSFLGCPIAASIQNVQEFRVLGEPHMHDILKSFYQGNSILQQTGQTTLSTIETLQAKLPSTDHDDEHEYHPEHGAEYPDDWYVNDFSHALKNLAQLIKMDVGVHMAMVEYGDWDHHENQAYRFPQHIEGLSNALAAFYNDMQHYHKRMTVVVMSEFGRRLKSNRSGGTDHGHGGLAFVLGGQVNGGKMYGQWPGLATHELDNAVDLDVTTDYRTILSEILDKRLNNKKLDFIFPGFIDYKPLGLFS